METPSEPQPYRNRGLCKPCTSLVAMTMAEREKRARADQEGSVSSGGHVGTAGAGERQNPWGEDNAGCAAPRPLPAAGAKLLLEASGGPHRPAPHRIASSERGCAAGGSQEALPCEDSEEGITYFRARRDRCCFAKAALNPLPAAGAVSGGQPWKQMQRVRAAVHTGGVCVGGS